MQQALAQIAQATAALQNAIATQRATPAATTASATASAPHAPAPTTATTAADDTTIGSRFEGDVLYPGKWDLSTPEAVRLKRLEVMQTFAINNRASAFRQRAFNVLSAWMDNAYEQAEWNEALVQVGVVAMENLRSCVATEDLKVNARDLFAATATPASDKLGEAISSLAKEAEKRGDEDDKMATDTAEEATTTATTAQAPPTTTTTQDEDVARETSGGPRSSRRGGAPPTHVYHKFLRAESQARL